MKTLQPIRVGIVGTGYISRHFYMTFHARAEIEITRVLTRRPIASCGEYPNRDILTNNLDDLLDQCDLVYECSGDAIYAHDVIAKAIAQAKPVVTTNSEFHVTTGSYFAGQNLLTEAEGDQPGALAALHYRALEMGFKPLAYCNMKGFLNHTPTEKEMTYWAGKQGISLTNVTSFTDGTKIQIEQALVANGLGATFAKPGMIGLEQNDIDEAAKEFAEQAKKIGKAISDYIIFPGAPHGVFLVAEHDAAQAPMLRYVKLGDGPYYILRQDAILLHLEVFRTIYQFYYNRKVLLDNSNTPEINVATVAKQPLNKGDTIEQGIGGFDVRGLGVKIRDYPNAVPIGLITNAQIKRTIEPNQIITFDDIELPESQALNAWHEILQNVLATHTNNDAVEVV